LKATYNKIRPDFSLDKSADSTRCESLFSSCSCEQNRPSDDASDLFQELVWAFRLLKAVKLLLSSLLFPSLSITENASLVARHIHTPTVRTVF
jgi:hypothetical protein